ncbi:MAG: hypothetical protein ABIJ56_18400 [Pseudomonadota bacterium]
MNFILMAAAVAILAAGGIACTGEEADLCDRELCNQQCQAAGHLVGVCYNNVCECLGTADADAEAEPEMIDVIDAGADPDLDTLADIEVDPDIVEVTDVPAEDVLSDYSASCDGIDTAAMAGIYSGTFMGFIHFIEDYPMSGNVFFTLTPAAGESWTFDGSMYGTAEGGYIWSSGVQGIADCGRLSGAFYDGTVTIESVDYHFSGTMESGFMPYIFTPGTFEGVCDDLPIITGDGSWSANHI